MWVWFLAGSLVLFNAATVVVIALVVRSHMHSAGRQRTLPPAALEALRRSLAEQARRIEQLADRIETQLVRRDEKLEGLLAELDCRVAEIRRATAGLASPQCAPENDLPHTRRLQVRRLADQNVGPLDIARRLGVDIAEVELILALRRATTDELVPNRTENRSSATE
jgi:hypothetical protein